MQKDSAGVSAARVWDEPQQCPLTLSSRRLGRSDLTRSVKALPPSANCQTAPHRQSGVSQRAMVGHTGTPPCPIGGQDLNLGAPGHTPGQPTAEDLQRFEQRCGRSTGKAEQGERTATARCSPHSTRLMARADRRGSRERIGQIGQIAHTRTETAGSARENGFRNVHLVLAVRSVLARGRNLAV